MKVESVFSFLVHPSKSEEEQPPIRGAALPLEGTLFDTLRKAAAQAEEECNLGIAFEHAPDGEQRNERRSDILACVENPCVETVRVLAQRLQSVTTRRSGLGLLFVVLGTLPDGGGTRVYISRFPADTAIMAEERDDQLRVELLERVFLRSRHSYKAVFYEDTNRATGFWTGKAVDRQVTDRQCEISGYWIRDFLLSQFLTTPERGTREFANALKAAMKATSDPHVKEELAAAAVLLRGFDGEVVSPHELAQRLRFSPSTWATLKANFLHPSQVELSFPFSYSAFQKVNRLLSVTINNGAILSAPSGQFESCFRKEPLDNDGTVRFSTCGRVVDQCTKA